MNRRFRGIALINDTQVKITAKVLIFSGSMPKMFDNSINSESYTERKRKHQQQTDIENKEQSMYRMRDTNTLVESTSSNQAECLNS